jgi:hypothetical protein
MFRVKVRHFFWLLSAWRKRAVNATRQRLGLDRFETADGISVKAGDWVAFNYHGCLGFGVVDSYAPWFDGHVVTLRNVYIYSPHYPNGVKATVFDTDIYRYWVHRF